MEKKCKLATAKITNVVEKPLGKLTQGDKVGHEKFSNDEEMYKSYEKYYSQPITPETLVKILTTSVSPSINLANSAGDLYVQGRLEVDDAMVITGGFLRPYYNNQTDLGQGANAWKNVFTNNFSPILILPKIGLLHFSL